MALLEIACFNPEGAILAYEAGADRIELCDDREAGGTTPHPQWLSTVKARVNIPVYVMIRPRGGDFVYSPAEFDQMGAEIDSFKPHANGYVFGILDHECRVDIARTAELVQRAHPLPCTFHRGFDETRDPFEAFEDVISSGCKAILSSGGAPSAHAGINILNQLVRMSLSRIIVMPGGSVRANNVAAIRGFTGATVFHSSACLRGMSEPDAHEIRQMKLLLQ